MLHRKSSAEVQFELAQRKLHAAEIKLNSKALIEAAKLPGTHTIYVTEEDPLQFSTTVINEDELAKQTNHPLNDRANVTLTTEHHKKFVQVDLKTKKDAKDIDAKEKVIVMERTCARTEGEPVTLKVLQKKDTVEDHSKGKLTEEEREILAYKMASSLLLNYKLPVSADIIVKCNRTPEGQIQALKVEAALRDLIHLYTLQAVKIKSYVPGSPAKGAKIKDLFTVNCLIETKSPVLRL